MQRWVLWAEKGVASKNNDGRYEIPTASRGKARNFDCHDWRVSGRGLMSLVRRLYVDLHDMVSRRLLRGLIFWYSLYCWDFWDWILPDAERSQ